MGDWARGVHRRGGTPPPRQPPPPPQRLSSARPPKALTSALFRQVLSLVLGAAFFLGQLVDNQDPDEL